MISASTIERIKDMPIADVISHYVDLKKAGTNYKAHSPFTDEKTPSFYVVPSKNIFKCFSTGLGGGAIKFVMELRKVSFVDAIKEICGNIGERIEYEISEKPNEDQESKEQLYKINEAAAKRFCNALYDIHQDHWSNRYLQLKLRYTPDTIFQWQIGYAPEGWDFLTKILTEKALVKPAVELGLVREKDQRYYDAFRDRIIYPIHNHLGRLVGFGGRAQKEDKQTAKYINSGESKIFEKKAVLFGLYFAIESIRKEQYANLMEGYTDVISFHQVGYTNTVATCGTALTQEQCKLLKKYCSKVVLFPDPDNAGEKSALRSMDILMAEGFEVAVVPMPKKEGVKIDPDELTRMFV